MQLAFRKLGKGTPLIILHGLYGSSDNWYSIGKKLAEHFEVYLLDLRNHGKSPHSNKHTYTDLQSDVLEFFDTHAIEKATVIGHSMGGKAAMLFALNNPQRIENLIVVDIAPKSYKSLLGLSSQAVGHLNIVQALTSLKLENAVSRNDIDVQLSQYIPDISLRQFLLKNIGRNEHGQFYWLLNIQAIRNSLPDIMEGVDNEEYIEKAKKCLFPTLFIKGEKSDYILDEDVFLIKQMFPKAEVVTVFDASHWVHSEQPDLFLKTLHYFLQKT